MAFTSVKGSSFLITEKGNKGFMNEEHISRVKKGIKYWTSGTVTRVKNSFGVSQRQWDLLARVLQMRSRVQDLPAETPIYLFGHIGDIRQLFRYTEIKKKKIQAIVTDDDTSVFFDIFDNDKKYSVLSRNDDEIKKAHYIVSSEIGKGQEELFRNIGFSGKWISLYEEGETVPFNCVNICGKIVEADPYYMGIVRRVDKINKKLKELEGKRVLIYCAGMHTDLLLKYTNVSKLDIVGVVDKKAVVVGNMHVLKPEDDILSDCDSIIISSFLFQKEIYKELEIRGFADKVFFLYDNEDSNEFYKNTNTYSPDFPYMGKDVERLEWQEVYAEAEKCMQRLSKNSSFYMTYSAIDKNRILDSAFYRGEDEVWGIKSYEQDNKRCAVILQGPIIYEENFTLDTVRLYNRLYPGAGIIVSTWESERDDSKIEEIKKYADIVYGKMPEEKGVLNVNLQLKSTATGIRAAWEKEYEYVLKTRTDFRLHAPGVLSYLGNMTDNFPAESDGRKRLSVLQPKLDAPYFVPDFVMFGSPDEMAVFWDDGELFATGMGDMNPEMLLFSRYMKKKGCYVELPLENLGAYARAFYNEFIVTDPVIYKYIWRKYSYENEIMMIEAENLLTSVDWFNHQFRKKMGK